jgi:hypothetical protein
MMMIDLVVVVIFIVIGFFGIEWQSEWQQSK